ncbi:hypothetical protein BpHYR1_052786 [Brachionus plicatilis]|uniref:Uncharacterized protein n=1 Tax=Brachionus plicatilis TaxID=10195 RepID=A0A3M7T0T4_BRAPC|nr:hypothetical protein BpHYR1_052786 [Brachionus plicatilis]
MMFKLNIVQKEFIGIKKLSYVKKFVLKCFVVEDWSDEKYFFDRGSLDNKFLTEYLRFARQMKWEISLIIKALFDSQFSINCLSNINSCYRGAGQYTLSWSFFKTRTKPIKSSFLYNRSDGFENVMPLRIKFDKSLNR